MTLFRSLHTAAEARLIFVGDIHGCYDELQALLELVKPAAKDVVISVGDVVTKGPAAAKCLELWRHRKYLAVKGNNELKVLDSAHPLFRFFATENRDVMVRRDLLRYIASWPLVLDFPDANVTAVHGGFLPQMQVTEEDVTREQELVPKLRWIRRKDGEWVHVGKEKKKKHDVLWSEKWKGERTIVYGHTPVREPKRDAFALGLDTGCVYGGHLTAAILTRGEWTFQSVQAKRAYA
jgi:predicted phosphodiesterase